MGTLIVVGVIALVVIIFAVNGLIIIRQSETKVIERLGRYHSTLSSGINIIWPIIDRPRKVYVRHMVSGPLVGVAIGYGLDAWLDTGPWCKLIFLFVGIGAGFLNVYRDSRRLLARMAREDAQHKGARNAVRPEAMDDATTVQPPATTAEHKHEGP